MAKFRFRIIDSQGRRRSGIVRADSLKVAEGGLRAKLCEIEELTPIGEEAPVPNPAPPGFAPRAYLGSLSQVERVRAALALFLACVFFYSLVDWARAPGRPVEPLPQSDRVVTFTVRGELDTSALRNAVATGSDVKVYAVFPDLAYEVRGELGEDGKSFDLPVELVGQARPASMILQVSVDGERWTIPTGTKVVAPAGDVELGTVVAEKAQEPLDLPGPGEGYSPVSRDAAPSEQPERKSPQELKTRRIQQMEQRRLRISRGGPR